MGKRAITERVRGTYGVSRTRSTCMMHPTESLSCRDVSRGFNAVSVISARLLLPSAVLPIKQIALSRRDEPRGRKRSARLRPSIRCWTEASFLRRKLKKRSQLNRGSPIWPGRLQSSVRSQTTLGRGLCSNRR